jgi:hypothetical protein
MKGDDMKLISPSSLRLSRVYFTEFDRITYSQVAWRTEDVDDIRRNLERKLKLLALIKGHIIIASSHLIESELAYDVLFKHPRLFTEGLVVPALRSEFKSFEHFLDTKISEGKEACLYEGEARRDMAQMLDTSVAFAVCWEVKRTSKWFKDRLVYDIKDEGGLLRSCLRTAGIVVPPDLSDRISKVQTLSRKDVYVLAKGTHNKKLWEILCNYGDFVYYLSGAKAVQSEGVLPQENLMDFSLSDMASGRTRLSEMEVFFKIFVDIVKTVTHTHFPVDILDTISIEDALDLHRLALEDRFVEKYNTIQERTKEGLSLHDPERLVLLMEELELFERQLHDEYQHALQRELPRKMRNHKIAQTGMFLNATASLVIPLWGAATGIHDVVVAGLELGGIGRLVADFQARIRQRIKTWLALLNKTSLDNKPVLLDFVKRVQQRYSYKMFDLK